MKKCVFLVFCLHLGLFAEGMTPDRIETYKKIGGVELKLHIFEPSGLKSTDKRPAIIFFFGGGWKAGSPKQFYEHARKFADLGILAFSAEYRLIKKGKITPYECVKDAKSAIRWVRTHAGKLGVDPKRIIASGGSAGGHIAACTGIVKDNDEKGEDLKISSQPNLMILYNPVIDTTKDGYGAALFKKGKDTTLSPCHQVRKAIVPTQLFHGTKDTTVPFENAERFTRLMKEAGNECQLVPFEGKAHGFFNGKLFSGRKSNKHFDVCMEYSVKFLGKYGYSVKK